MQAVRYLDLEPDAWRSFRLSDRSEREHQFDADSINAVNAALASGRPLLVRGEPGLGKTQLAEAAAFVLERAFLPVAVDSRTEHRDLLWSFDAVRRLAMAQSAPLAQDRDTHWRDMDEANFVRPGPLWWAFNWTNAESALTDPKTGLRDGNSPLARGNNRAWAHNGWVLLIDEIDKAEPDVPNGLLEALGALSFTPYGTSTPVTALRPLPLVVITTNEERSLSAAFVRRCIVLELRMPGESQFKSFLIARAARIFPDASEQVLSRAASQLARDRDAALADGSRHFPGQAEYLDLIRTLVTRYPGDVARQLDLLDQTSKFYFRKRTDR